jgi:hypothetical protein
MSQRNIGHIGKPSRCYRVDLGANAHISGFETLGNSHNEDIYRAKQLRSAARWFPEMIDTEAVSSLAAKLEAAGSGGEVPESLACSTYMRGQRINISGALWKLIKESTL